MKYKCSTCGACGDKGHLHHSAECVDNNYIHEVPDYELTVLFAVNKIEEMREEAIKKQQEYHSIGTANKYFGIEKACDEILKILTEGK